MYTDSRHVPDHYPYKGAVTFSLISRNLRHHNKRQNCHLLCRLAPATDSPASVLAAAILLLLGCRGAAGPLHGGVGQDDAEQRAGAAVEGLLADHVHVGVGLVFVSGGRWVLHRLTAHGRLSGHCERPCEHLHQAPTRRRYSHGQSDITFNKHYRSVPVYFVYNALVNNSHIRYEQVGHRSRHICTVSVVLMDQSMVHSSLERRHRTHCYCRHKVMMHTALEGFNLSER